MTKILAEAMKEEEVKEEDHSKVKGILRVTLIDSNVNYVANLATLCGNAFISLTKLSKIQINHQQEQFVMLLHYLHHSLFITLVIILLHPQP